MTFQMERSMIGKKKRGRDMKVCDMHCDTIMALYEKKNQETLRENHCHIDLKRMREADYLLQTFAVFVAVKDHSNPLQTCLDGIDLFYRQMAENSEWMTPVTTVKEAEENKKQGKMSALLSVEEGAVCLGDMAVLRMLYRLGVRMLTLTWNHENELGYPHCFHGDPAFGLKETGIAFVEEMERIGMIIDVSHLSDEGFYDVLRHTKKPFVASHSNARSICSHTRNMTDDMIRSLAQRGGVMGLNFYAAFTCNPNCDGTVFGTMDGLIAHIRHIIQVGGTECIGLGSDFDGIGTNMEMKDCSYMPRLADALAKAGFQADTIEKIFYKNTLRVMKEILG